VFPEAGCQDSWAEPSDYRQVHRKRRAVCPCAELMQRYSNQASIWEHLRRVQRTLARVGTPRRIEPEPTPAVRARLDQRFDAETRARLVADYQAGTSTNQLMKDYDIGKGSVLRLLREAGVTLRNQRLSPAALESAVSLYNSGLSLKVVGERLGFSIDAVRAGLLRAGSLCGLVRDGTTRLDRAARRSNAAP